MLLWQRLVFSVLAATLKKNPFHSVFNFSFFSPFSGGGGAGFALDLVCVCVSVSVCLLGLCYRKPRSSLDYTVGRETVKAVFFFTEFYVVLPSFTVLYRVLMGFTEFCFGFELILPGFTMFYRVSPSSTGFY